MKRSLIIAACLAVFGLPLSTVAQTDWPQKPVTLVVPYPPGGVNDAVARAYANKLAVELGKPILIDNRAGAGTTIASTRRQGRSRWLHDLRRRHVAGDQSDAHRQRAVRPAQELRLRVADVVRRSSCM
jgi:hypothetical protein